MWYCIAGNSGGMNFLGGLSYKFFIDWQVGGCVSLSVDTQVAGLIWQMNMEISKTSPPELSAIIVHDTCTLYVYMYFKCILYFYRRQRVTQFSGLKLLRS